MIAVLRTASNKTGIVNRKIKWSQVRENFLDTHTYLLFLLTVLLNIPNGGLSGFYPIIINSLGFTTKQTSLLSVPTLGDPRSDASVTLGPVVSKAAAKNIRKAVSDAIAAGAKPLVPADLRRNGMHC